MGCPPLHAHCQATRGCFFPSNPYSEWTQQNKPMLQRQTCKAQVEQQGLSQQKFSLLSPLTPSPKKNMFDRDSPNGSCSEKGEGCTLFLHTAHNRTNTLSQVGQIQSHLSSCSPPTAPAQAAAHATRDTSATASFPPACANSPSAACQNSPTASFSRLETSRYCIMPVLQLHHSVRALIPPVSILRTIWQAEPSALLF